MERANLRQEKFRGPPTDDPRWKKGLCADRHYTNPVQSDIRCKGDLMWGGNASGCWCHCNRCALRLGYWPAEGNTGKFSTEPEPEVVHMALELIRRQGKWETCTARIFKIALETVASEKRSRTAIERASKEDLKSKAHGQLMKEAMQKATLMDPIELTQEDSQGHKNKNMFDFGGPRRATSSTDRRPAPFGSQPVTGEDMMEGTAESPQEMQAQIEDLKRELKKANQEVASSRAVGANPKV